MSPTNPRATPCCEFCRHPECVAARAGCSLPDRQLRQDRALVWTTTTFGAGASTPRERATRLLEEAAELAQAEGVEHVAAARLLAHVFLKPPGEPAQELGGVGVCVLAYAGAAGLSADAEEARELARVLALPPEHFRERQNVKADAGVAVRVGAERECDVARLPDSDPTLECRIGEWWTNPRGRLYEIVSIASHKLGVLRDVKANKEERFMPALLHAHNGWKRSPLSPSAVQATPPPQRWAWYYDDVPQQGHDDYPSREEAQIALDCHCNRSPRYSVRPYVRRATFALVKPDVVSRGKLGMLLSCVEMHGFVLERARLVCLTGEQVDDLYREHVARDFYPAMRAFLTGGPSFAVVMSHCDEGRDPVKYWREKIGATDPKRRRFNDLRKRFEVEGAPMYENAVHGSDSSEAAEREIALFFPEWRP